MFAALIWFALLGVLPVGCDESKPIKGCITAADCTGGQICENGRCRDESLPDGGDGADGDSGDGSDGSGDHPAEEGPACSHDRECPPDQVCNPTTGTCIPGRTCKVDRPYQFCDLDVEYCDPVGLVCKRRSKLCEPCAADVQCPDPVLGDMCITYPTGRFCGQACGVMACKAGFDCDLGSGSGAGRNPGQCRARSNDCKNISWCTDDTDCAGNELCDKPTGNCIGKCTDDAACPENQKCHLSGRCGPPCASNADCGGSLICCTAPGGYCDAASIGRCRPSGCALHRECPVADGTAIGYCDKRTGQCMTGCRAADARTVDDCKSGMKCECTKGTATCDTFDCCGDPGQPCLCDPSVEDCSKVTVCTDGTCSEIPCQERGDVHTACSRNQACCGLPIGDGYPCPASVSEGECYLAVEPVCKSCSANADCDVPGYGFGEKGVCLADGSDNNQYCHLGCRTNNDCPATWSCDYSFFQGCNQNAKCSATATCDMIYVDQDGNRVDACHCKTDADCPSDFDGFKGHCSPETAIDLSKDPPERKTVQICQFAKACQCESCCSELKGR